MDTRPFDGSLPGPPVGYFSYQVDADEWSWSDGVYSLHGFEPGEVPATLEVLLRHKHPEDRDRVYDVVRTALEDGEPYSCYHRIIDRHERIRSVLGVGRGFKNDEGNVVRLEGFYVDLTDVRRGETEAEVEVALVRIAEHRSVIDQAKGALMLASGCDADEAFQMLRRSSQHANLKLNEIARRLVGAVGTRLWVGDETRVSLHDFLKDPK